MPEELTPEKSALQLGFEEAKRQARNAFDTFDPMAVETDVEIDKAAEAALRELEERLGIGNPSPHNREDDSNELGGAPVLAVPVSPRPTREGGAARTFEEAEQPPRNP